MLLFWCLIAFIAGAMVTISSILNAQAGRKIGVYRAALVNNVLGTMVALGLVLIVFGNLSVNVAQLREVPLWVYSGGLVTVLVVVGSNIIIPKIPIVYTTLFVFIGQFITALILDKLRGVPITLGKTMGLTLILLGLVYNLYIDIYKRRVVE